MRRRRVFTLLLVVTLLLPVLGACGGPLNPRKVNPILLATSVQHHQTLRAWPLEEDWNSFKTFDVAVYGRLGCDFAPLDCTQGCCGTLLFFAVRNRGSDRLEIDQVEVTYYWLDSREKVIGFDLQRVPFRQVLSGNVSAEQRIDYLNYQAEPFALDWDTFINEADDALIRPQSTRILIYRGWDGLGSEDLISGNVFGIARIYFTNGQEVFVATYAYPVEVTM